MPSPFPGMDPYLEGAAWESFHAALIDEMGRQLAPRVRPKYFVRVERRFVTDGADSPDEISITARDVYPDVGVLQRSGSATDNQKAGESGRPTVATLEPPMQLETVMISWAPQRSLAIVDAEERKRVAAVELLSPSNKRVGGGRDEYLERRDHFLSGDVHLIEIDLLRRGTRLPTRSALPSMPYFAFLSRARRRPMTGVWPIGLREALPTIAVPLLPDDADVPLDLQAAFSGTYDAFGFDLELDYRRPPPVSLPPEDVIWAEALLAGWDC